MTPAARSLDLVRSAQCATLATLARDPAGYPFGSLVAVAADARGRPLLLLSKLAEHTQNLLARAEASLLFCSEVPAGDDPLAAGRVTVLGRCEPVPAAERDDTRALFLARHPNATAYVDFADFAFYRLEPEALRWVGGFGRMTWVTADDYRAAAAAPSP
ncbi:MAG: pyridoxamine 5'-phosphate oxidase family protein [Labilithrix sp.]|nr:pyridoxamine 5'-phosphate oxidase family protein [Labilithrix sp.]MCW5814973.1 pyridoxamine 5'-phosphate oxidase family protein [Labilithrix sp.]